MKGMTIIAFIGWLCLGGLTAFAQKPVTDSTSLVRGLSDTPADLIVGKVSGVGATSADGSVISGNILNIRGVNSLRSDNQPLYIIDGVRMSTDVNRSLDAFREFDDAPTVFPNNPFGVVAPLDIESIMVLKDAAATALYGSDAANGVVLITTKSPSEGSCKVDWLSNVGVSFPSSGVTDASAGVSHNHYARVGGKVGNSRYSLSANFRSRAACIEGGRSDFGGLNAGLDSRAGKCLDFGFRLLTGAGRQNRTDGVTASHDDGAVEYRGLASAYANFSFAKMFRWENSVSADWMTGRRTLWYGRATEFGARHNVAASMLSSSLLKYSARTALNLSAYIVSDHRIAVTAGAEYIGKSNRWNTLSGQNMLTEELRGKAINFMNSHFYPYAHDLSQGTAGAFATVGYDCMGYASVTAGARTEFSPKYDGWSPVVLPTASARLDLRKLFGMRGAAVSCLAITGNLGASMFQDALPYDFTDYVMTARHFVPAEGGSPFFDTLVRLCTREWTAGVEAGFIDGRISLTLKYYDRKTADRFSVYGFGHQVDVSGVAMWTSSVRSLAQQKESVIGNRGVELDFNAIVLKTRNASLKLYGTGSYNANCLLLAEAQTIPGQVHNGEYSTVSAEGFPVGMLCGYRYDADGNPMDLTGEGEITAADKVALGSSVPRWLYSFGIEARWGGFRAEAMLYGAADFSVFNPDGRTIRDGSFVRFGRLGLGYDLPLKMRKVLKALSVMTGTENIYPQLWTVTAGVKLGF